jgi:hypothetical protein
MYFLLGRCMIYLYCSIMDHPVKLCFFWSLKSICFGFYEREYHIWLFITTWAEFIVHIFPPVKHVSGSESDETAIHSMGYQS